MSSLVKVAGTDRAQGAYQTLRDAGEEDGSMSESFSPAGGWDVPQLAALRYLLSTNLGTLSRNGKKRHKSFLKVTQEIRGGQGVRTREEKNDDKPFSASSR